jgi:hypothetical protein
MFIDISKWGNYFEGVAGGGLAESQILIQLGYALDSTTYYML